MTVGTLCTLSREAVAFNEYWWRVRMRVPARQKSLTRCTLEMLGQLVCTGCCMYAVHQRGVICTHNQSERVWISYRPWRLRCCYCCNYCKHAAIPRAGPNGLGAQPCRIGYTEVPFRARFVYLSSVLYRITTIVSKPTITWTHGI